MIKPIHIDGMSREERGLAAVLARIDALYAELAETMDRQVGVQLALERTRRELSVARAAAAESLATVGRSCRALDANRDGDGGRNA